MHSVVEAPRRALSAASEARNAAPDSARSVTAKHTTTSTTAGEFLSFRLGAEEYGIDILRVQEIRSYETPTEVANAPPFVMGVVNLRGVAVPIVDLRLKLNCTCAEYTATTVVIVLSVRERVIGVVVDSVSDVLALTQDQVKRAPEMNSMVEASHITGIGCVGSGNARRMLILLDIESLLSSADMGLMNDPLH